MNLHREKNDSKGIIFDIQRYAIHDGPGIRMLIFLKGCPLHCPWCDNPESQNLNPELVWFQSNCIGCKRCLEICPNHAIADVNGHLTVEEALCNHCEQCVSACPSNAWVMIGKQYSLKEIIDEVNKDRIFFENSGGGVTLSGGEPTFQPQFLEQLLVELKKNHIHTAIETCGCFTDEIRERISDFIDLFLFDLKITNPTLHRKYLGVDNTQIMKNLKRLVHLKKPVIPRFPIIPGYTDDDENITKIAEFIDSLNLKLVHILPYHNLGQSKYPRLKRKYQIDPTQKIDKARINEIVERLKHYGFDVKIGG